MTTGDSGHFEVHSHLNPLQVSLREKQKKKQQSRKKNLQRTARRMQIQIQALTRRRVLCWVVPSVFLS